MQATLSTGTVILEHYVVVRLLSQGKSNAAYLVKDRSSRPGLFVLKVIPKPVQSNRYQIAFEIAKFKSLRHPSLPPIYHVYENEESNCVYILMQYSKGQNLEGFWRQRHKPFFSWPEVKTLLTPIVSAVAYLHTQQPPVIHGNIKLSNIVVRDAGREPLLVGLSLTGEKDSNRIREGKLLAQNGNNPFANHLKEADPRTDIYALATVFYILLTGNVPPDRFYRSIVVGNKKPDPLVPLNKVMPTLPPSLTRAITRALSLNNDCFESIEQFWHSLNNTAIGPQMPEGRLGDSLKYVELDTNPYVELVQVRRAETTTEKTQAFSPHSVMEQSPETPVTLAAPPETPPINETVKQLLAESSQKKLPVIYQYRARLLLAIVLTLFLTLLTSTVIGVGLWLYTMGQHPASVHPLKSTPNSSQLTPTSTNSPIFITYPTLDKTYNGTIHDIAGNLTTQMFLQNVQQQQGNIKGNFRGFLQNGSFSGRISTSKRILFVVVGIIGLPLITFEGVMQTDGGFAGTYCSRNQSGACKEYGVWSVSPLTSE